MFSITEIFKIISKIIKQNKTLTVLFKNYRFYIKVLMYFAKKNKKIFIARLLRDDNLIN